MKRIVLTEDDDAIRDIFHIVFDIQGIEIESYDNGDGIISEELEAPALFILDKQISGTNGLEVCRFIKSCKKYSDIPVLMLSADPDIFKLAQEVGADGAIAKPFSLDQLRATVLKYVV